MNKLGEGYKSRVTLGVMKTSLSAHQNHPDNPIILKIETIYILIRTNCTKQSPVAVPLSTTDMFWFLCFQYTSIYGRISPSFYLTYWSIVTISNSLLLTVYEQFERNSKRDVVIAEKVILQSPKSYTHMNQQREHYLPWH